MDATRGDMFGENELLGLTVEGRRNRTSVAQTSCELCRMSASHFRALLESCPDLQRRCRLLVYAHLNSLQDLLQMGLPPSRQQRYCVAWKHAAELVDAPERPLLAGKAPQHAPDAGADDAGGVEHEPTAAAKTAPGRAGEAEAPTTSDPTQSLSTRPALQEAADGTGEGGGGAGGGAMQPLTTLITLQLRTLVPVEGYEGRSAACFRRIKYAVLGLQYPGTPDVAGSRMRIFSDVFRVFPDETGQVAVQAEVVLHLRHRTSNWHAMPPLRVALYAVFYPDSFVAPQGYLPNLDDPLPPHEAAHLAPAPPHRPTHPQSHAHPPPLPPSSAVADQAGGGSGTADRRWARRGGDALNLTTGGSNGVGSVGWITAASERDFQRERPAHASFPETHKAGIQPLAVGCMSLRELVHARDRTPFKKAKAPDCTHADWSFRGDILSDVLVAARSCACTCN